jgi:hypothetical protein
MKTKVEYLERRALELKAWGVQGDLLAFKTEKSVGMMELKYIQELIAFRAKQNEATEIMKYWEEASDNEWGTVKETADNIWDELRTCLANAALTFK